jgi:hypothetical protein
MTVDDGAAVVTIVTVVALGVGCVRMIGGLVTRGEEEEAAGTGSGTGGATEGTSTTT